MEGQWRFIMARIKKWMIGFYAQEDSLKRNEIIQNQILVKADLKSQKDCVWLLETMLNMFNRH